MTRMRRRMHALGAVTLVLVAGLSLSACEREKRGFTSPETNADVSPGVPRNSGVQPAVPQGGEVKLAARDRSPYDGNAYAVAQGKRLFRWYNCSGCHANGGGGMGPALMDDQWRYGSSPASIYDTIVGGRPNGMPSFGGHIPEDQVWQLVAYVRSMSGKLRKDVAPGRNDGLYPGAPEVERSEQDPQPEIRNEPRPEDKRQ